MKLKDRIIISPARKAEIQQIIINHLESGASFSMEKLRKRFTDISRATFYRLLKEVNEKRLPVGQSVIKAAEKQLKEVTKKPVNEKKKVAVKKPAAEAPADNVVDEPYEEVDYTEEKEFPMQLSEVVTVSDEQEAVVENKSFTGRLEGLYQDARAVRNYSVIKEGGVEKIKNPIFFMASIKMRRELLESAVNCTEKMYSLERIQKFYDVILDEIGKVDRNLQIAVLNRLREINKQYGMNVVE